jgi:hypothetical protein
MPSQLSVLSGGLGEALQIAQPKKKRPVGVWRNPVWLPSRIPVQPPALFWGPGYKIGVYEWPSREVAEQKALDWLQLYTDLGWIEKFGRPRLYPPKFFPSSASSPR